MRRLVDLAREVLHLEWRTDAGRINGMGMAGIILAVGLYLTVSAIQAVGDAITGRSISASSFLQVIAAVAFFTLTCMAFLIYDDHHGR